MKISVNGEAQVTTAETLADLLTDLDQGNTKVATAVNEVFVAAATRANCKLEPGDRVEIVAPRQGG